MIRKYLRSDGQHFEVDAGTAADEAMQKDGAFTLTSEDGDPQPVSFKEAETVAEEPAAEEKTPVEAAAAKPAAKKASAKK